MHQRCQLLSSTQPIRLLPSFFSFFSSLLLLSRLRCVRVLVLFFPTPVVVVVVVVVVVLLLLLLLLLLFPFVSLGVLLLVDFLPLLNSRHRFLNSLPPHTYTACVFVCPWFFLASLFHYGGNDNNNNTINHDTYTLTTLQPPHRLDLLTNKSIDPSNVTYLT